MGEQSKIQWTDHTFNLVWGCQRVSPACQNCYAESFANRLGKKLWGPTAPRQVMGDAYWREPLKWNRKAEAEGIRRRVFCSSMADVFEDHATVAEQRPCLWDLIEQTPALDWLLLTKRPENIRGMLPAAWLEMPRPNVWLGTTVENQEYADRDNWLHVVDNEIVITQKWIWVWFAEGKHGGGPELAQRALGWDEEGE